MGIKEPKVTLCKMFTIDTFDFSKHYIPSNGKRMKLSHFEMSGIPVAQKENVIQLVMDVGTALGTDVMERDISAAHRVPSYNSKRTPALNVQFVSRAS